MTLLNQTQQKKIICLERFVLTEYVWRLKMSLSSLCFSKDSCFAIWSSHVSSACKTWLSFIVQSWTINLCLCVYLLGRPHAQTVRQNSQHALWPASLSLTTSSGCVPCVNIAPTRRTSRIRWHARCVILASDWLMQPLTSVFQWGKSVNLQMPCQGVFWCSYVYLWM